MWNILKKAVVQKHTDAVKELKTYRILLYETCPSSQQGLFY